jgi:hypothetical protein
MDKADFSFASKEYRGRGVDPPDNATVNIPRFLIASVPSRTTFSAAA